LYAISVNILFIYQFIDICMHNNYFLFFLFKKLKDGVYTIRLQKYKLINKNNLLTLIKKNHDT
jgi:hypothetical protein